MNPTDPILDQPQSIESEALSPDARYRLANQELTFVVDPHSDLHALAWPWANTDYAAAITLKISDPQQNEALMALVTRYFPGYQETILGSEGMIVGKRLAAPLGTAYDRAVIWTLDCQAEGDRLLRLEVDIDWGQPLVQRMVDGLLVAQHNPQPEQGLYAQRNADSTRVFGNPYGQPSAYEWDDAGHARLIYYVLVNGMVEVPLLLTVSDVGEQVAWNGFLGLRDTEHSFQVSNETWERALKTGRLWTPDARFNRAVQAGRLATLRHVQRLPSGLAPSTRLVEDVPVLVRVLDTADLVLSRNMLAHVRRVAERSQGRLPVRLPVRAKDALEDPAAALATTNTAYLTALLHHLQRHPHDELLSQHYAAVTACAETLMYLRAHAQGKPDPKLAAAASAGLRRAVTLATMAKDGDNTLRWENEACDLEHVAEEGGIGKPAETNLLTGWEQATGWTLAEDQPWHFTNPQAGMALAGDAVWSGCGLQWRKGKLHVYPQRGNKWAWWALLDMPYGDGNLSLVWDGKTLHATKPVVCSQGVELHRRIRALQTDELDFDLHFEMTGEGEGGEKRRAVFRPQFAQDEI